MPVSQGEKTDMRKMVGKKILGVEYCGLSGYDDEPILQIYLESDNPDGYIIIRLTSVYGGYTGISEDEYPAFMAIKEVPREEQYIQTSSVGRDSLQLDVLFDCKDSSYKVKHGVVVESGSEQELAVEIEDDKVSVEKRPVADINKQIQEDFRLQVMDDIERRIDKLHKEIIDAINKGGDW